MADLPEYQPNSQVTPGPLVNAAPIYQSYAKMAEDIDKDTLPIAQDLRDQQIKQEATVAGNDPAFKTIPSIGAAAKEYNEIGLEANKQAVTSDIITHLNQFHQEALEGGVTADSVNQYTQKAQAYLNGLMQTVPVENRALAKNWWTSKSTQFQVSIQGKYNEKLKRDNQLNFYNQQTTHLGEISENNLHGNTTAAAMNLANAKQNMKFAVEQGFIKPKSAAAQLQSYDQTFHTTYYQGIIRKIHNDPMSSLSPEEAMIEKGKKVNELIDAFRQDPTIQKVFHTPALMHSAVNQLQDFAKEENGQNLINQHTLQIQQEANLDKIYATGKSDLSDDAQIINGLSNNPEKLEEYMERKQATLVLSGIKNKLVNGTAQEKDEAYNNLLNEQANPTQYPGDPVRSKLYKDEFAKRAGSLIKLYKTGKTNLADTTVQTDLFQNAMKTINNQNLDPLAAANARSHALINVQKSQGYSSNDYKLATTGQVAHIATELNAAKYQVDPKEQQARRNAGQPPLMDLPTVLGGIQQVFGNDPGVLSSVYNQLQASKSVDQAKLAWLRTSLNPKKAADLNIYEAAFNHPLSESLEKYNRAQPTKVTKQQLQAKFYNAAAPVLDVMDSETSMNYDQSAQLRQNKDAIQSVGVQIAAWRMANLSESPDEATKNAADSLLNSNYTTSSINGSNFLIPKTAPSGNPLEESTVKKIVNGTVTNHVRANDLLVPPNWPGTDPKKRQSSYNFDLMANVRMVRNGQGWNYIDETGNPVRTKDGKPLYLSYEDAANPSSETALNAMAAAQPKLARSVAEELASTPYATKIHNLIGSLDESAIPADQKDHPYWALLRHLLPENGYSDVEEVIKRRKERLERPK